MQQANNVSACHRKAQAELPSDRIRRQHLWIRKLTFDGCIPHILHMDVLHPRSIYRRLGIVQSASQSSQDYVSDTFWNGCLVVQVKEQDVKQSAELG